MAKRQPLRTVFMLLTIVLALPSLWLDVGRPLSAAAQSVPTRQFVVAIKQRKLEAADNVIRVTQGDAVEIVLTADEEAELHLHGYDLKLSLAPNVAGTIRFTASIAGRFPLEAHQFGPEPAFGRHRSASPLLYVEVYPR